jgi:hypothetical protein
MKLGYEQGDLDKLFGTAGELGFGTVADAFFAEGDAGAFGAEALELYETSSFLLAVRESLRRGGLALVCKAAEKLIGPRDSAADGSCDNETAGEGATGGGWLFRRRSETADKLDEDGGAVMKRLNWEVAVFSFLVAVLLCGLAQAKGIECRRDQDCKKSGNGAQVDLCTKMVCIQSRCAAVEKVCPPSDQPCWKAVCSKPTGKCGFALVEDGTPCDSGSLCEVESTCVAGQCEGKTVSCDDKNPCSVVDECDDEKGCTHEWVKPGTAVVWDDKDPCWDDNSYVCVYGYQYGKDNLVPAGKPVVCPTGEVCVTSKGGCVEQGKLGPETASTLSN